MGDLPEQYHKIIGQIVDGMRDLMAKGDELTAMAFLGKFDRGLLPIPMAMVDDASKDKAALLVRDLAKAILPDYAIMISEGWTLPIDIPKEEQFGMLKKYGSINECPCREEIVFITLETLNGIWMARQPILNLEGSVRGFKDFEFELVQGIEGRFVNFLRPTSRTVH